MKTACSLRIFTIISGILILLPHNGWGNEYGVLTIVPVIEKLADSPSEEESRICGRARNILFKASEILKQEAELTLAVSYECLVWNIPPDVRNRLKKLAGEVKNDKKTREAYGGAVIHALRKHYESLPQDRIAFFASWLASSNGDMPGKFFTVQLRDDGETALTTHHELGHTFGCGHDKGDGIMGKEFNTSYSPQCKKLIQETKPAYFIYEEP